MPGESDSMARQMMVSRGFNPRPALMPGESIMGDEMREGKGEFQSTPGINAGRIPDAFSEVAAVLNEFQSTPGINAGRIPSVPTGSAAFDGVSIHARH